MGNLMSVGIIGLGFVGSAVLESFKPRVVKTNDPKNEQNSSYDELKTCEALFVCVPSPSKSDGSCDTSILEDMLTKLKDYTGVIISKVTAPPNVYSKLQKKHHNLIYIPEFLTAQYATSDYKATKKFIIGGNSLAYQNEAIRIMKHTHKDASFILSSIEEASLTKYTVNAFLATKVLFMNEMYNIADTAGLNWDTVQNLIQFVDKDRIGNSHMMVPGPDGKRGFGGMCFPKDTSGLLHYAKGLNVDLDVLTAAVNKNKSLRDDL